MILINVIAIATCSACFAVNLLEPFGTPYRRFWVAFSGVGLMGNGIIVTVSAL
jgi:hypothetical protein